MQSEVVLKAQEQLKTLREAPVTSSTIPRNAFISVTAPAISPDGLNLAVITEDDGNSRSIKIITREGEQSFLDAKSADTIEKFNEALTPASQQDAPPKGSIQRLSWFPDSQRLIYDKIDYINRIQRYSDLHIYDLKSKKAKQLTTGLRGREPSVSPQGDLVTFVKVEGGKTHLGLLKMETPQEIEILYSAPLQERISYPLFWDQDTLLFSLRKVDGSERLHKYTRSTKQLETLFSDYENIRFARKTSEGLIFTSGKNGALNLYLASADLRSAKPITNTLTAFFTADIDPLRKEIFATQMTAQGLKVTAVMPQDWKNTPEEIPQISPLLADRYAQIPVNTQAEADAKTALEQSTIEDYSPYGYLWPQYWIPFIAGSSSETGVVLQVQTSGFDPLKKHSYTLLGEWDTGLGKGNLAGTYLNQTTSLPFAVLAYKRSSYLGTVSNELTDYNATVAALPSMYWMSVYANLQVGWQYLERSTLHTDTKRTGPYVMFSYKDYAKSGAQVSPESGVGGYLGAYDYIAYDNYLSHSQFVAGGEIYFSKYLPKHNAIMVRANAIYTPEKVSAVYGAATEAIVFIPDSPLPQYILRGYKRGQIFGRNLATVNLEYRFPIHNIYSGSGTDPIFLRRFTGALVADGAAADGLFVNDVKRVYETIDMKRSFWSAGLEGKLETTLGYVLPVNFVIGYYVAFNSPEGPEGVVGTTLQIIGF
ncbi:hypothetical protein QJS83_09825 [Bdellovibrio sp. 22V]|uniref:TolB family protein n=1 Tax=Bdellovibrio sp. 22V TaxID=3044166 RepID=UPI002542761B|nr:hypothetical protein [Bdellovibrio sp. 22V]WII70758.1 hypothetical protein QJS83_09825 [Bdellovibrio sp. 22V]